MCGDEVAEGQETCDGDDLKNKSCTDFGTWTGGTLQCQEDCNAYDLSECCHGEGSSCGLGTCCGNLNCVLGTCD